jgi:hypothetical protein
LGYSSTGYLQTNLFSGAIYNLHQMNIYAQIYGSDGVFTIYDLLDSVTVIPDTMSDLSKLEQSLIKKDPTFSTNILLSQGSYLQSIQEIQKISDLLNRQSLSDALGLLGLQSTEFKFPPIYGPLAKYEGVLAVKFVCISSQSVFF